ncbi:MAG: redox-sensing transcriptional repressor Rex [Thermoguttaceae bacterium]|nr:redox-sensing transcriptional repressor Rex [Thermoguttaceae bacterium]
MTIVKSILYLSDSERLSTMEDAAGWNLVEAILRRKRERKQIAKWNGYDIRNAYRVYWTVTDMNTGKSSMSKKNTEETSDYAGDSPILDITPLPSDYSLTGPDSPLISAAMKSMSRRDRIPPNVPLPSVRRLPGYLRYLQSLERAGREVVSCTHIADELSLVSTQVRKDLAITGIVGKPKVGYLVGELIEAIEDFLGWNNTSDAFLVGAGSLGSALLGYEGFADYGLNLVAGFDVDPRKVGTTIHDKPIFSVERLVELSQRMHVHIGVLTTPPNVAQEAANCMVRSGFRAIWNYTVVQLNVPSNIVVEDVKLTSSFAVLSSRLAELLHRERKLNTALLGDLASGNE